MRAVPGLNAVHIINGVRLNDKTDDSGVPILPRVRLLKIGGWNNRPNMTARRTQFIGRSMREGNLSTTLDGKPLVYDGIIEARNQDELEEYIALLQYALSPTNEQMIMVEPYYTDERYFYRGQIEAFDPPEELPSSMFVRYPFSRSFTLGIYMLDPRKYSLSPVDMWSDGRLPALIEQSPSGGLVVPFIPPVTPPARTAELEANPYSAPGYTDTDSMLAIAVNPGSAPTEPTLNVIRESDYSSVTDVRSETLNRRLYLNVHQRTNVEINFYDRSIVDGNTGEDLGHLINDSNTDWWDPGVEGLRINDNHLRLILGGYRMRVRYYPAFF